MIFFIVATVVLLDGRLLKCIPAIPRTARIWLCHACYLSPDYIITVVNVFIFYFIFTIKIQFYYIVLSACPRPSVTIIRHPPPIYIQAESLTLCFAGEISPFSASLYYPSTRRNRPATGARKNDRIVMLTNRRRQ